MLLAERRASPEEERLLDDTIGAFRRRLEERYGLRAAAPAVRFNRRKLDLASTGPGLVPSSGPEAVEEYLRTRGVAGGLAEVVGLLPAVGLRVTTDGRWVEVGLTDKADAARWLSARLARAGLAAASLVFVGDEFATTGGLVGSDARVRIPELREATFVSVSAVSVPEPGVVWLGGGTATLPAILEAAAERAAGRGLRREA